MMPASSNSHSIINPSDDHLPINNNQMDSWSSILSGKSDLDSPPYIHPTAKCSLSDNSLEICTESLGSETGSDGFSSYDQFGSDIPSKQASIVHTKNVGSCKRLNLDLPPPLPSLSLQMQSRRENGRLVMEAVHVAPFESRFRAKREDGRLLLSFSDDMSDLDDDVEEVTPTSSSSSSSSSGEVLKAYVWEYWRNNKLDACKSSVLLFKETTALPLLLSNI